MERARRGEKTRGRRPTTSEGRRRLGRRARERTFSGTRSACSSAGSCWRTRTSMRRGAAGGAGSVEPTSAIARREGGGDRAARGARGLCQIFPPSLPGVGEPTGRGAMPLGGARRAAVMKKTRTTRVCGTKTTRPERLSRDPSISPDSNVSGGVALQFVRFPSGRGRALGVHDRARSPPRAPTPRRGRDPRTPRVDRAEASLRRCVPSPRLLAGARSSIDPVVVVYGLLRGPAGVLVDAPSPARSRARRAPLPSP